jgi:acyl carrier protein
VSSLGAPRPQAATIDRVRSFIIDELGWRGDELTPAFPLLENRVIDSLGLFRIVGFLETEYGVKIPDDRLVPASFSTLETIAQLVEQPS